MFQFFSSCFTDGSKSITKNANLVQSLSFPRMSLPFIALPQKKCSSSSAHRSRSTRRRRWPFQSDTVSPRASSQASSSLTSWCSEMRCRTASTTSIFRFCSVFTTASASSRRLRGRFLTLSSRTTGRWSTPHRSPRHFSSFGTRDRQFDTDVGFYVFRLPFLESARGFIWSWLRKNLDLRVTPQLLFRPDRSMEHAAKIQSLLKKVQPEDGA